jgi:hypothetical protein
MESLYQKDSSIRLIFILKSILGLIIIVGCVYIIAFYDGFPIIVYIAPLLGLALVISSLTDKKIFEITLNTKDQLITINKLSLFGVKARKIKIQNLSVELKSDNARKHYHAITKLRLVILDSGKEVEEIKGRAFEIDNEIIEKLYYRLKKESEIL